MVPGFAAVCVLALAGAAAPRVQPLFVAAPGSGDAARQSFGEACQRAALPAPQTIELAGAPAPEAAQALREASALADELRFEEAARALDRAAHDAEVTGAAGLGEAELADVYLLRALVGQHQRQPNQPRVWEDLVRAATLTPERVLDRGRFPPAVLAEWKRAVAEVQRRPRGTLVVRAPSEARISIDARPAGRAPAVAPGLPFGQHHVRVEEPGRLPWATVVALGGPTVELEVPARPLLALDDGAAAGHGRRLGARTVLVAQPRAQADGPLVELRLVDVAAESSRERMLVESDGLAAAVSRLAGEAEVRRPPERGPAGRDFRPALWIAGGAAAVVLSVVTTVLLVRGNADGPGFSSAADPRYLGQR
jgi:hypothetical protein